MMYPEKMRAISSLPQGVWPVMLTPFTDTGEIDWSSLDRLVDWYLRVGVAGLFAVCLSSEMYKLSDDERLALARHVVRRADGRVPVVATGTFGGAVSQQALFVRQVSDCGVAGVVAISNQLAAKDESDSVWKERAENLMLLTGDISLGLYECPVPYKRLLSPDLLQWAAESGRFLFHKDTACAMEPIHSKLAAIRGTAFRWFNANCATLLASLEAGGDGYSGIAANFMPELYVWLCANHAKQRDLAGRLQRFLSIADAVVRFKYPASAKYFLTEAGILASPHCRLENPEMTEEDLLILRDLKQSIAEWREVLS